MERGDTNAAAAAKAVKAAAVMAVQAGDVDALAALLAGAPALARAYVDGKRTLLHVATDWPGHFPHVATTIAALVDAGADVNARFQGSDAHAETPLHWAASSDDVAALDALLDRGADVHANGGVIGGGTALADAVAFGNWACARRLVARGAVPNLWQAAALGDVDRVTAGLPAALTSDAHPSADEQRVLDNAFWSACHGGQRATAELLRAAGADISWLGHDGLTPLGAARRAKADDVAAWLVELGAR